VRITAEAGSFSGAAGVASAGFPAVARLGACEHPAVIVTIATIQSQPDIVCFIA
jgi:hypothetical protein